MPTRILEHLKFALIRYRLFINRNNHNVQQAIHQGIFSLKNGFLFLLLRKNHLD